MPTDPNRDSDSLNRIDRNSPIDLDREERSCTDDPETRRSSVGVTHHKARPYHSCDRAHL